MRRVWESRTEFVDNGRSTYSNSKRIETSSPSTRDLGIRELHYDRSGADSYLKSRDFERIEEYSYRNRGSGYKSELTSSFVTERGPLVSASNGKNLVGTFSRSPFRDPNASEHIRSIRSRVVDVPSRTVDRHIDISTSSYTARNDYLSSAQKRRRDLETGFRSDIDRSYRVEERPARRARLGDRSSSKKNIFSESVYEVTDSKISSHRNETSIPTHGILKPRTPRKHIHEFSDISPHKEREERRITFESPTKRVEEVKTVIETTERVSRTPHRDNSIQPSDIENVLHRKKALDDEINKAVTLTKDIKYMLKESDNQRSHDLSAVRGELEKLTRITTKLAHESENIKHGLSVVNKELSDVKQRSDIKQSYFGSPERVNPDNFMESTSSHRISSPLHNAPQPSPSPISEIKNTISTTATRIPDRSTSTINAFTHVPSDLKTNVTTRTYVISPPTEYRSSSSHHHTAGTTTTTIYPPQTTSSTTYYPLHHHPQQPTTTTTYYPAPQPPLQTTAYQSIPSQTVYYSPPVTQTVLSPAPMLTTPQLVIPAAQTGVNVLGVNPQGVLQPNGSTVSLNPQANQEITINIKGNASK